MEIYRRQLPLLMETDVIVVGSGTAGASAAIAASRQDLAGELVALQPSIARMGRRSDILISRLRLLVEGMGGSLEVRAHFPEADIIVTNFNDENRE